MPDPVRATVLVPLLLLPALAGTATPALGQAADRVPTSGDWSVSLAAFESDDLGFGLHHMISDRVNLGLEVDLDWTKTDARLTQGQNEASGEARAWSLLAGPVVRWYGTRSGPISPYLRFQAAMGWGKERVHTGGNIQDQSEFSALLFSLGIGAEWYPVPELGIGGHTGLQVVQESEDLNPVDNVHLEYDTWSVSAFRSGIRVSLYFR